MFIFRDSRGPAGVPSPNWPFRCLVRRIFIRLISPCLDLAAKEFTLLVTYSKTILVATNRHYKLSTPAIRCQIPLKLEWCNPSGWIFQFKLDIADLDATFQLLEFEMSGGRVCLKNELGSRRRSSLLRWPQGMLLQVLTQMIMLIWVYTVHVDIVEVGKSICTQCLGFYAFVKKTWLVMHLHFKFFHKNGPVPKRKSFWNQKHIWCFCACVQYSALTAPHFLSDSLAAFSHKRKTWCQKQTKVGRIIISDFKMK